MQDFVLSSLHWPGGFLSKETTRTGKARPGRFRSCFETAYHSLAGLTLDSPIVTAMPVDEGDELVVMRTSQ